MFYAIIICVAFILVLIVAYVETDYYEGLLSNCRNQKYEMSQMLETNAEIINTQSLIITELNHKIEIKDAEIEKYKKADLMRKKFYEAKQEVCYGKTNSD